MVMTTKCHILSAICYEIVIWSSFYESQRKHSCLESSADKAQLNSYNVTGHQIRSCKTPLKRRSPAFHEISVTAILYVKYKEKDSQVAMVKKVYKNLLQFQSYSGLKMIKFFGQFSASSRKLVFVVSIIN